MRIHTHLFCAILLLCLCVDLQAQQLAAKGVEAALLDLDRTALEYRPLGETLLHLEHVYDVHIIYDDAVVHGKTAPYLVSTEQNFQQALEFALAGAAIAYEKVGARTIVLTPRVPAPPEPAPPAGGTIKGRVTDATGAGIPLAQVFLEGTTIGDAADDDGNFEIRGVPPGTYTVKVRVIGYKTESVSISISVDETVTRDFSLVDDLLNLQEIVVTGVQNPKTKIESSVAITTLNARQIEDEAPLNTADLLKSIPGFVAESSGGEVGNNLFPRGIPAAGAYEYVQVQEDGLPVFEDGALQFANVDNWFRLDETVDRMESVRGGSGAIFATNAPGGIINFISKTGGSEFAGTGKLSVGDYGLFRTDLNMSGPINEELRYNVGGFYRYDEGIRSPGFPANRGGQVKGNLTYLLEDGYIRAYGKHLDDRNLFLLPIPLQNPDDPDGIPGFDPNFGTYASVNANKLKVPQFGGGFFERSLEDGIHPIVDAIGGEAAVDIGGGFSVKNSFRFTNIDLSYQALFPGAPPTRAADFAANFGPFGREGLQVSNPVYTYADDGSTANPNLVAEVGFWSIDKQMQSFANNLQFTYDSERNSVQGGYYYGNYTSDQQWNWSNILLEVAGEARLLNLADGDKSPGDRDYSRTLNGVTAISWLTREAQTRGNINAFYINDEFQATDQITIDAGLRYEVAEYSGFRANSDFFSESLGDSTTSADDFITVTGGPNQFWKYGDDLKDDPNDDNVDRFAVSVGGNYAFNEGMAAYVRVSNGFRSPIEEAYFDNVGNFENIKPTEVTQIEAGFKYAAPTFAVFANAFYMNLDNIAFTDIKPDGSSENAFGGAENIGLELEAIVKYREFGLNFTGTVQDPELQDFGVLTNNRVRRIPRIFLTVRPSYEVMPGLHVYGEVRHFGNKFSDNENQFKLPSFTEIAAGASYRVRNLRFAIDATNLGNTVGLTEGNPRASAAPGEFFNARPILGRAVRGSVSVDFR